MKALKGYKMHLITSRLTKLLLCSLVSSSLYANNTLENSILKESRKQNFELSNKQNKAESSKLKKDWINPIQYQFTKSLGEDYKTEKSVISINQPIFQSGGIYQAIKYANSTYDYASLEVKQQEKELIEEAIKLLFQIRKSELNIQKAKYSLANAKIDVKRKKEQVLNGFLDASYLDDALLTQNNTKHNLIDLNYQKEALINSFNNLASKDYTKFKLPTFKLFTKEEFMQNNIEIKKAKANIKRKKNFSYMTTARYLPSVNVYYNYSKYHDTDNQKGLRKEGEQNFGLTINIPFDSRTFNDIESKKIDYLKSKLNLKNKISDENTFFKTKLDEVSMLEDRLNVTKEDLEVYNSILKTMQEEKEAELKTQSDLDTLQNSQKIKELDLQTFEIDRQLALLEIYAKLQ